MTTDIDSLTKTDAQQKIIQRLVEENQRQSQEIDYLKERIELLVSHIYGKKSERRLPDIPDQISYLEDPSDEGVAGLPIKKVSVPAHTRKKAGRKPLPAELPRVEVIHDIPESEKRCACGSELTRIGEEVSERLNYIPAKLEVERHIRPKYACKSCEGIETEGATVKIAPVPKQIIEKSIASAGLLAHIVTAKFVDGLPFYRQEKQFARLGYEISRANMTNWTIQLGRKVARLLGLLKRDVLSGPLIQMDETTIQVLKEKDRSPMIKSYMWVTRGGPPGKPGIYFHYDQTRSTKVAREILKDYQGVVQTDGYGGYDYLDHSVHILHAGCWAHARRKFMEVLKAKGKHDKKKAKIGHAEQAVDYIGQIYAVEREATEEKLSLAERGELRKKKSKPVLDVFRPWLEEIGLKTPPKGLLGKAIGYTLKRWDQLTLYLDHSFVPIDNNLAENTIRPFVVGRKNWLFCDTVAGAEASAALYSLIETARANGLNSFDYLKSIFEKLPYAETEGQIKRLLPQYHNETANG